MCNGFGWAIVAGDAKKRGKLNAKAEIELRVRGRPGAIPTKFLMQEPRKFQTNQSQC